MYELIGLSLDPFNDIGVNLRNPLRSRMYIIHDNLRTNREGVCGQTTNQID